MIISLDIGVKNFGIYLVDKDFKPIHIENINLSPYSVDKIINLFSDKKYKDIELVLIENQMNINKLACKIQAHLEMFFAIKNIKIIFCSPSKKDLDKTYGNYKLRKKLSVLKAKEYLEKNNYIDFLEKLNNNKKKDDISDAICQLLSYFKIE